MPAPPAKPRRPRRRRPAHDADPLGRLLVKYDEQGRPVRDDKGRQIFWVIGEGGHLRRLVFPIQPDDGDDEPLLEHPPQDARKRDRRPFGGGDGPPDDLPAPLKIKPAPGQRRPPKTPAGTWEDDDDLLGEVSAIVGKDRRDRKARGRAIVNELRSMAARWLGRDLTEKEDDRLQALALGQKKIRRALGEIASRKTADRTPPTKASAIVLELLTWRHGLTYPAVREMQLPRKAKPVARDFTALVLKYEADQPLLDAETGTPVKDNNDRPILVRPPVCNERGQPIVWVPDEHGQPSRAYGVLDEHGQLQPFVAGEPLPRRRVKAARPRVKMIFR